VPFRYTLAFYLRSDRRCERAAGETLDQIADLQDLIRAFA